MIFEITVFRIFGYFRPRCPLGFEKRFLAPSRRLRGDRTVRRTGPVARSGLRGRRTRHAEHVPEKRQRRADGRMRR